MKQPNVVTHYRGVEIEWRHIDGFPNYRVSNMGVVQSRYVPHKQGVTGEWRNLMPEIRKNGYAYVYLYHRGKGRQNATIHSLVLEAFVGPRPAGYCSCHANGIRTDNRLPNLRWDTRKANERDKHFTGTHRQGAMRAGANLDDSKVSEILELLALGIKQKVVAQRYGVCDPLISEINTGKRWQHVPRSREEQP